MRKRRMLEGTLVALLVLLDQVTKYLARVNLTAGKHYNLIRGVMGLCYTENTGAAFSSFSNSTNLLTIVSAMLVLVLAAYLLVNRREEERFIRVPVLLILSGGIGNLIDRALRNSVTDFFELEFIRFAVFNVADVLISGGALLLTILVLLRGGKKHGAK